MHCPGLDGLWKACQSVGPIDSEAMRHVMGDAVGAFVVLCIIAALAVITVVVLKAPSD